MSGYIDFTNGAVADADQVQQYLMDQVVARFASVGERDSEIPAPGAGRMCFVTGTGWQVHNGTAWVTFLGPTPVADSGWIAPTFATGWINYGAPYDTVGYRQLRNGMVILKGLARTSASTGASAPIFTLPVGYRPSANKILQGNSTGADAARIDILPSGAVQAYSAITAVGTYMSLEGITFMPSGV